MGSTTWKVLSRAALVGASAATVMSLVPAAAGAPAGRFCTSFSKGGLTYRLFASSDFTCTAVKAWVVKLSGDDVSVDPNVQQVPLSNGPGGYKCFARARKKGHASAGICYKGSLAFPKSEFTWLS